MGSNYEPRKVYWALYPDNDWSVMQLVIYRRIAHSVIPTVLNDNDQRLILLNNDNIVEMLM